MTLIQLDIPQEIMKRLAVESAQKSFNDKRIMIIEILKHHFKMEQEGRE